VWRFGFAMRRKVTRLSTTQRINPQMSCPGQLASNVHCHPVNMAAFDAMIEAGKAVLEGRAKPALRMGRGSCKRGSLESLKEAARRNPRVTVSIRVAGQLVPVPYEGGKDQENMRSNAANRVSGVCKVCGCIGVSVVNGRTAEHTDRNGRACTGIAPTAAQAPAAAAAPTAAEAPAAAAIPDCYRCSKPARMGYVLDGQTVCRDCRGAHREAYYAQRGQSAPTRQPRQRGAAGAMRVERLQVTAEHCEIITKAS
jgi:hypothetical protein